MAEIEMSGAIEDLETILSKEAKNRGKAKKKNRQRD